MKIRVANFRVWIVAGTATTTRAREAARERAERGLKRHAAFEAQSTVVRYSLGADVHVRPCRSAKARATSAAKNGPRKIIPV